MNPSPRTLRSAGKVECAPGPTGLERRYLSARRVKTRPLPRTLVGQFQSACYADLSRIFPRQPRNRNQHDTKFRLHDAGFLSRNTWTSPDWSAYLAERIRGYVPRTSHRSGSAATADRTCSTCLYVRTFRSIEHYQKPRIGREKRHQFLSGSKAEAIMASHPGRT
jgi:hypothetical protein